MHQGDGIIVIILAIGFSVWGFIALRRWIMVPVKAQEEWKIAADDEVILTEAVELLEEAGYVVLTNKKKIPLTITVDGQMSLPGGLYIDHFAELDGDIYIVRLASDARPLEFSAKGLRDQLLIYHLLYPNAAGILYVDTEEQEIHRIEFALEEA